MNRNVPMIKKERIFSKIKNWFKGLFSKEEIMIEPVQEYTKSDIEEIKEASFKEGLKIKSKDVILFLQKQFESNEIKLTDLTDEQLEEMLKLYEFQIKEKKELLKNYDQKIKKLTNQN